PFPAYRVRLARPAHPARGGLRRLRVLPGRPRGTGLARIGAPATTRRPRSRSRRSVPSPAEERSMPHKFGLAAAFAAGVLASGLLLSARSQTPDPKQKTAPPHDPAAEALRVKQVPADRPEQKLTAHDKSDAFDPT